MSIPENSWIAGMRFLGGSLIFKSYPCSLYRHEQLMGYPAG